MQCLFICQSARQTDTQSVSQPSQNIIIIVMVMMRIIMMMSSDELHHVCVIEIISLKLPVATLE